MSDDFRRRKLRGWPVTGRPDLHASHFVVAGTIVACSPPEPASGTDGGEWSQGSGDIDRHW